MSKTLKTIWKIFTTLLVVAAILLAVALVGVRLLGYQVFTVLSGSMEPEYHVGSLIYVKEVDYTQLKPGDVITYLVSEDTIATHRITEVLIDENDPTIRRYFTKGDANDKPDAVSVHCANILGSPVVTIPYLGYVANYIQNPPGTYVTISVIAILILLIFLPDLFGDDKSKDKKKADKKTKATDEQTEETTGEIAASTEQTAETTEETADTTEETAEKTPEA